MDKKTFKKFGITFGLIFLVISSLLFFRHKYAGAQFSLVISGIFAAAGLFLPAFLKPAYIIWMRFVFILGWINTRLILIVMFYAIFAPLGLFMKLFRIDLLGRRKTGDTYWNKKIEPNPLDYERRF